VLRQRGRFLVSVTVVALVVVAAASAARIVGSDGNDTIRGTAKADSLYGKKGNDTLYGLGGKDLLVPGAGRDRVYCGSGVDTVIADAADKVAKDCEVVRRSPPTIAPPPPAPPPPPPPPPPPAVTAGKYAGVTSQNERISFEVLPGGTQLRDLFINSINLSCQPPNIVSIYGGTNFYNLPSIVPIIDLAFRSSAVGLAGTNEYDIRIDGRFSGTTATGTVVDTLRIPVSFIPGGYVVCTAPNVTWAVSLVP